MKSPSCITSSATEKVLDSKLTFTSSAPTTQTLPICLPTTAAWLVLPPLAVKSPLAADIPCISSGLVSLVTRTTLFPCLLSSTAVCASSATCPEAAPGEAAKPFVRTLNFFLSSGSNIGNKNCSRCSGSTLLIASFFVIRLSLTISQAIFAAAIPDLLPDLV